MFSSGSVDPITATCIGDSSQPLAARESGWRSPPDSGPRRRLLTLVVLTATFAIWNLQLYQQLRLNADAIGRLEASVHSTTEHLKDLRLEADALLADLPRTYAVRHLVIGHSSPRPAGSIQSRFGGKILLIDSGPLSNHHRGGRGSALEIHNGRLTAICEGERSLLEPGPRVPARSSPTPADPRTPWAASETVGSLFSNPYSVKVATIVIESGDEQAGKWVGEERDFVEDYRRAFGQAPQMIAAVAIVVDTDDTDSEATAWFDDVVIEVENSGFAARTGELLN